jgi:putative oxidoreductase
MALEYTLDRAAAGSSQATLEDAGKLLLRLTIAGLMLFHGIDKLGGVNGPMGALTRNGFPGFMVYGVYLGEIVAPLLIIAGFWTRPAALLYAFTVAFATWLVHSGDYAMLKPNGAYGAELHVFYIACGIAVALLGAGRYSVRGGKGRWD